MIWAKRSRRNVGASVKTTRTWRGEPLTPMWTLACVSIGLWVFNGKSTPQNSDWQNSPPNVRISTWNGSTPRTLNEFWQRSILPRIFRCRHHLVP